MRGPRRAAALALVCVFVATAATSSAPRLVDSSAAVPVSTEDWNGQVSAFPLPGTSTASPQSGISLRGVSRGAVGDVEVAGSESGPHPGRLHAHPDGNGVTFQPDEPFKPGEVVTVETNLNLRGGRDGRYEFAVARPAKVDLGGSGGGGEGAASRDKLARSVSYQSAPGLHPPKLQVDSDDRAGRDGAGGEGRYIFLGPNKGVPQAGPLIVDSRGEPVWFRPLRDGTEAWDFRVQKYRGKDVLTWWEGRTRYAHGRGELVIADKAYREIARVKAGNGYFADLHEAVLTPRGTALLLAYLPVYWDMSPVGGDGSAAVFDTLIQEVDVASGDVLFEWHSLGAIGLDESIHPIDSPGPVYDYLHPNSIDVDDDGNLLLSARHTNAVYKIDRATGKIMWRLGGKRSDFEMGDRERFGWQHDARRQDDGTITILDNSGFNDERRLRDYSRGIVLDLDMEAMKATLVREYKHPDETMAYAQANMQTRPNGNVCIGWGTVPAFTEYAPDGRVIVDGRLPPDSGSYRAYCSPWKGQPTTRPAVDADPAGGNGVIAYASWNGATEVARWQVLAGPRPDKLTSVTSAPRTGFETPIVIDTESKGGEKGGKRAKDAKRVTDVAYVAVHAEDDAGKTLGISKPVRVARD